MDYDLVFLHPPSVYDFRKKPWFPGHLAGTVHFTPVFEGIPIGLISMADYAQRHGYKVKIFNLAEYMITDQKFNTEEFIKKINAAYFGIDLHFCVHSQGAIEVARLCKYHHEDSSIIMGGLTATKFSYELLINHPYIDYVIRGEGEVPILKLLGEKDHNKVPNLLFKDECGHIKESELIWKAEILDEFDFTNIRLVTPRNLLTVVPTESKPINHWMIPVCRGCLFNCAACGGSRYSYSHMCNRESPIFRSKEKIVEDLCKLAGDGIESVFLFMDSRMGGRKYWKSLMNALSSNSTGLKSINLELFTPGDKEFLSEIAHLNNTLKVGLSISPESGNEDVRRFHGRHYTNESLIKTATFCRKNMIDLAVFFMFGLASENEESINDTYNLCTKLTDLNFEHGPTSGLGHLIKNRFGEMLLLDPGSPAYDNPKKFGYKLLFKTLQDYKNGISSPAWSDWLSYETSTSTRREILERPLRFYERLIRFYYSRNLISDDQFELAYRKAKVDRIVLEELENIRKLKQSERKEKRYWELYTALKDYEHGKLSLSWRIKKMLGIF